MSNKPRWGIVWLDDKGNIERRYVAPEGANPSKGLPWYRNFLNYLKHILFVWNFQTIKDRARSRYKS